MAINEKNVLHFQYRHSGKVECLLHVSEKVVFSCVNVCGEFAFVYYQLKVKVLWSSSFPTLRICLKDSMESLLLLSKGKAFHSFVIGGRNDEHFWVVRERII